MGKLEKCQEFTAFGKAIDDEIYHFQVSEDFCPSRHNIEFLQYEETSMLLLISDLDFNQIKKSWGYPLRFGFFEIIQHDFDLISSLTLQHHYV